MDMVQPTGYFRLWRELITKPIWLNSTPEQCKILIVLLSMANFNDKQWEFNGEKYSVKRGQFITSLDSIVSNCGSGISVKNVRTALKRFEKLEFLASKPTNKNRLITIVNWELYQQQDEETASKTASKRQAGGKQTATREEGKNDKNDKKEPIVDFSEQIKNYSQDEELCKTIIDYLDHRKELKKPIKTLTAINLLFKELDKHKDKLGVLNQSILNGWQGIFEIKTKSETRLEAKQITKEGISDEVREMYEGFRKT